MQDAEPHRNCSAARLVPTSLTCRWRRHAGQAGAHRLSRLSQVDGWKGDGSAGPSPGGLLRCASLPRLRLPLIEQPTIQRLAAGERGCCSVAGGCICRCDFGLREGLRISAQLGGSLF